MARLEAGYATAETWVRDALRRQPDQPSATHTLAMILTEQGVWEEAFQLARKILIDVTENELDISNLIQFVHAAMGAGRADGVRELIAEAESSPSARHLAVQLIRASD